MVRSCQPLPKTKPDVSGWILAGEVRPELSQEGAQTAMAQLRSGPCSLDQVPWVKAGGMGEPGSTRANPALALHLCLPGTLEAPLRHLLWPYLGPVQTSPTRSSTAQLCLNGAEVSSNRTVAQLL